ncbi:DoxX family protein [Pyruvatibacter sp.]|uniref:DoxX family protein n=1 Tax=Pyruvatibacter sp. TaxID=1981328 RepID=UPI003263FE74
MTLVGLIGRILLGTYFLLPGIMKFVDPSSGITLMTERGMPLVEPLYWAAAVLEVVLGAMLIIGFRPVIAALSLAALTLAINIGVHNFWAVQEDLVFAEAQLFVKNTGILAGLLVAAAWEHSKRA